MGRILEAVIQPRMDQEKKTMQGNLFGWLGVNVFANQEIFYWKNIKSTLSGKKVQSMFYDILERLMTEDAASIRPAEMEVLTKLVSAAAKEKNRELNHARTQERSSENYK